MTPIAELNIAGARLIVVALEPGRMGDLIAILDQAPQIRTQGKELILTLRQGANLEPYRLVEPPEGARLRLRPIY